MFCRMILNEVKRNKIINITTMIFITTATLLVSIAAILLVNLSASLDTLMTQTKAPHYFQMHMGAIDDSRLNTFVRNHAYIEEYQVLEFLNIEGSKIQLGKKSLADNVQDNGVSVQSPLFDYLVDLDGKRIDPSPGEIYVPLTYIKEKLVKVGETAKIAGEYFEVKGALRDSQMQSPMTSSKRFLIHPKDYSKLIDKGTIEYIIEFRLHDLANIGRLESDYSDANLEMNGPSISYSLLKIMNGLSDGIMIAIILLVAILIAIISFMCVRFTLLAKIAEDYREIGVLRAIGLRVSDIKRLYLVKYIFLAFVGGSLGMALSFFSSPFLLENIRSFWGESSTSYLTPLLGLIVGVTVFLLVILYTQWLLRHFKKVSAVEALHYNAPAGKRVKKIGWTLTKNHLFSINVFLGIKDVFVRKRTYIIMLIVTLLSSFILIFPASIYQTIVSPDFIKHIGLGQTDLVIGMNQATDIEKKSERIGEFLEEQSTIDEFVKITSKSFKVQMPDNTQERLVIELGDHEVFPIAYERGNVPKKVNEIALSSLNAQELDKKVGDSLTVLVNNQEKELKITGIYSSIFNGGKSAKANFLEKNADTVWVYYYASLREGVSVANTAEKFSKALPFAKVSDTQEYGKQTFGSTIELVKFATLVSIVIACGITMLITALFIRLLVAQDKKEIAILKAIGYRNQDIEWQYATRSLIVLVIAMAAGIVLTNTLGQSLMGIMMSSFGVESLKLVSHPLVYIGGPLLLIACTLIATKIGTYKAGKILISENLKE